MQASFEAAVSGTRKERRVTIYLADEPIAHYDYGMSEYEVDDETLTRFAMKNFARAISQSLSASLSL